MNKRLRKKAKKNRKPLFIGHPGSFMLPLWEVWLKDYEELLASGFYRKGQQQRKLQAKILKLKESIEEYRSRRYRRPYVEPKQLYKHARAKRNPLIVYDGYKFRR